MNNAPSLWVLKGEWKINLVEYINGSMVWRIYSDDSLTYINNGFMSL